MDPKILAALAAAARTFADTLDPPPGTGGAISIRAGSAESMVHVLTEVAKINDQESRGVNSREIGDIAIAAGMDPRGMAGYYTAASSLLEKKKDGRWITGLGRTRLKNLRAELGLPPAA